MTETVLCPSLERISQGDIFRDVEYFENCSIDNGIIEISKISFPNVIILTQDCDLAQEYSFRSLEKKNQDKMLISVLVAPLYNAEFVINGEHLSELGFGMRVFKGDSKTANNDLKKNNNPRYHYLDFGSESPLIPSIIDFKHYFSININYLDSIKKNNRLFRVEELYREDLSQRFASFLSRIGLPE